MAYWASDIICGTATAAAVTEITYGRPPTSSAQAGQVVHERAVINFASGTNPATNDVIEMAILPARHRLVDFALYADDLGSAELVVRMGIMTGTPRDPTRLIATVGAELLPTASTVLQAAALTKPTAATFEAFAAATVSATADRSIGIGWETQATTPTSGSTRNVILDLWYKAE